MECYGKFLQIKEKLKEGMKGGKEKE